MKILDVPQSGKRGVTVSQGGKFGQISRALAIPTNPRSAPQMLIRNRLAGVAAQWRGLTQEQRDAWTSAAKAVHSTPRMGKSGTLTGAQLFTKINVSNLTIGTPVVTDPPVRPAASILPVTALVITNTANVATLKLTTTDAPSDGCMLRGALPISQGRSSAPNMVYLGTLDTPANGAVDITALYKGRFGNPPAGTKVFVSVNQNLSGWQDVPHIFSAIVPAST
jgi:hypothetical protein